VGSKEEFPSRVKPPQGFADNDLMIGLSNVQILQIGCEGRELQGSEQGFPLKLSEHMPSPRGPQSFPKVGHAGQGLLEERHGARKPTEGPIQFPKMTRRGDRGLSRAGDFKKTTSSRIIKPAVDRETLRMMWAPTWRERH